MENMENRVDWLDTTQYPFRSHYLTTEYGKLHFIDEGQGDVLLFVHGTPTWSFLYRDHIKVLSKSYRCVAIDHLGFGLSDKPQEFAGTPQAHAENLTLLIEQLNLQNITLAVHDFGGPIGLSYAISNPENVKRIILFNTWLWETKKNRDAQKIDRILHSKLGNFLYLKTNFSPKVLMKKAFFDKRKLEKQIHTHYIKPFPDQHSRHGLLNIGKSLFGSSDWYGELWNNADVIRSKPTLILWGEKDVFIKTEYLEKWEKFFTNKEIHLLQSGHFVQEEKTEETIKIIENWMKKSGG
ncbi:MAG: alpha/beta fold hydrolase [Calditrichaeota bacterium]|nr:MAG: alpha/beta fold hydrolase [Calditrichota bacterium]